MSAGTGFNSVGGGTATNFKASVRVATTGNIVLSGTQTIDGVAVVVGNRVLVKDQAVPANNGIYVVSAGAWTRSTDADSGTELLQMIVPVEDGVVNADTMWVCTANAPIVIGVTALPFTQASAIIYTAGTGLQLIGNQFSINSTVITGAGTAGFIPLLTASNVIGDSIISQSGGTINIAGNAIVNGKLTVTGIIDPTQIQFSGVGVPDILKYEVGFFGTAMFYNVPTGSTHDFKINGVTKFVIDSTGAVVSSINGNTITAGSGTLTLNTFTLTVNGNSSVNGTFTGTSSGTNTGDQTIILTGEATGSGTGSFAVTLNNAAVIGKVLTGYVSGAGTITVADTILSAIQKLNGNIAAFVPALTATRIGFGDGSNLLSSSANFVWDNTNKSLKLGGATTTSWFSAFQNDPSLAGVTSWINFVEDGRDAQKDFFTLTSTKTSATSGGTDMVMKSRGAGVTTLTMLNDGAEHFAIKNVDGVAGFSSANTKITINKSFAPNADSTIDLGTVTRSWRTLFIGTGGGANGSINQLGNAVGTSTNFNVLLGNSRDDGAANKSAMIITGNLDYAITHYLSIRGGATNSVLWTVAPGGKMGIGLGGSTAAVTSPTAFIDIVGSTASNASLRMRIGVAPASPNLGDSWYDGTNFFLRATTRNDQIARVLTASATLNFPSVANNSEADLTIAVTGAALGDCVALGVPNGSQSATLIWYAWVSAAGLVTVRCSHPFAGGPIDPASGTFKITVFKNI